MFETTASNIMLFYYHAYNYYYTFTSEIYYALIFKD